MTEQEAYNPQDRAKIVKAEIEWRTIQDKADELARVLATAKMVALPTIRNRYAYHRVVDKHDPISAGCMAVLGRLLFRV